MKNLLAGLLRSRSSSANAAAARDKLPFPEESAENAARRHLLQVVLRELLRKSGIPAHWIDCHMLVTNSRARSTGIHLRLILKHWDERLIQHTFAFQQTLMADVRHFDPRADSWLHGASWQLDVQDQCPYTTLPDKSYWQNTALVQAAMLDASTAPNPSNITPKTQDEDSNPEKDLQRLFAIRDHELEHKTGAGLTISGYEITQPAAL